MNYPHAQLIESLLVINESADSPPKVVCDLNETHMRLVKMYLEELPEHFRKDEQLMADLRQKFAEFYNKKLNSIFGNHLFFPPTH